MLKRLLRYGLGLGFIGAGLNHFWHPALYLRMMPSYLPWHRFLVDLSGLMEVGWERCCSSRAFSARRLRG